MSTIFRELLQSPTAMDELRGRLNQCPMIVRQGPEEVDTLVHALSDIESSCIVFLRDLLPRLMTPGLPAEDLEDCLLDVREELRHIAYHIHDPRFFRTIEPTHEWITVDYDR